MTTSVKEIVYSCDNNYIEQTIVSLISLLKNNNDAFKVWIISDQITESNKRLILDKTKAFDFELVFLNIDSILRNVSLRYEGRHPKTIYAKLFLEDVISSDRVLYLDSDIVINGPIQSLWSRNMDDELIAGVQMPYSVKLKQSMGIQSKNPYLCDGLAVLNLKLWRQQKIGERCKRYIRENHGNPPMLSEGTLNYVCQNSMGVLEPKYNLMSSMIFYSSKQIKKLFKAEYYYTEEELEEARKKPVAIHYLNELYNRPWFEPCDHPYKEIYRDIYREAFGVSTYKYQNLNKITRMNKILKRMLPFSLYVALYHYKHKEI